MEIFFMKDDMQSWKCFIFETLIFFPLGYQNMETRKFQAETKRRRQKKEKEWKQNPKTELSAFSIACIYKYKEPDWICLIST